MSIDRSIDRRLLGNDQVSDLTSMSGPEGLPGALARLRPMVGAPGPEVHGRAAKVEFARFARAADDDNQIYETVAPPLYLTSIGEWGAGPSQAELRADGTGTGHDAWLPLDGLRLMGGGQELEFHEQVVDGTAFVATPTLEEVELREGRSGPLLLLWVRTDYVDASGRPFVVCRETIIARPPAP